MALLLAYATFPAFSRTFVITWLVVTLSCFGVRLATRWIYFRAAGDRGNSLRWERLFIAVSAATGLAWGISAWYFYTPEDSIYRVLVVLVVAGVTTGASRVLAPIPLANLAYVYFAITPLVARVLVSPETRSVIVGLMATLYLVYMSVAARQQVRGLRRTVRLGYENAALVESLGEAKERAEKLNQDLSNEIGRRKVVERELRTANEQAVAASRAKSEFLATMSHEIRTPMNGVLGMLHMVRGTPLTPVQREQVETAAASADTLLDLLNDILDFSKIESGRLELERIPFSPSVVVSNVVELLRPRASLKNLGLEVIADSHLPVGLIGDPTRLRQVLFNLLGNAIKFTDRGGVQVRVDCEPSDARHVTVTFAVADTGIGISHEAQAQIFTPFTQADSSMSRRFGGTGLGLAISQKLVEAMGSRLTVQSELKRGSTFQFTLRWEKAVGLDTGETVAAQPFVLPRLCGRVLVVEDDRINQRVIAHFLKQMGLESAVVEDGHAAVEAACGGTWDAILMDCQLPGIGWNGGDTAHSTPGKHDPSDHRLDGERCVTGSRGMFFGGNERFSGQAHPRRDIGGVTPALAAEAGANLVTDRRIHPRLQAAFVASR
ncbi:MAG: ATP-binding protein [Opitutaceae bacterium]|nr:ATP-binding protein [Opitutaceae bacterium]